MIDIIVPAYNAHETIINTLSSIAFQTVKDLITVYIVDDCSNENYDQIVKDFSKVLNIKLLKTLKNSGPGASRQLALDNSNGKYVMFVDADDLLYECFSIENLYKNMEIKNLDCAIGRIHKELEDGNFEIYDNHENCLHGKMYRRDFINKHNFRFNNSSSSEDKAFNNLFFLANPKYEEIPNDTYVYNYNKKSLTRNALEDQDIKFIKGIGYNMHWVFEEAMKRNFDKEKLSDLIFCSLYGLFEYYNKYINSENASAVLECAKDLYNDVMYLKNYCDMEAYYKKENAILYISFDEFKERLEKI